MTVPDALSGALSRGLSRRQLLRLAGAAALAAGGNGWLPRALAAAVSPTQTGTLDSFSPPADWDDFPNDPAKRERLRRQWSLNVNQWTEQAILGNPWTSSVDQNRSFYFNPLEVPIPAGSPVKLIEWIAFPNRISTYLGPPQTTFSQDQLFELADNGRLADGLSLPAIPRNVCPFLESTPLPSMNYGPPGPRGWQDEYCEWAVERDANGDIVRVMFTCENPEYWHTLWSIDPQRVATLYRQLVNPRVKVEDLYLRDADGEPVRDPNTDQIAYNPLNKWNNSTKLLADSGGAVHLTSPPNNLGAEIGLGAGATILRYDDDNPQSLICCTPYGQSFRHSDPHIGYTVNQAVRALGMRVTICDPVGLYIQQPDFGNVQLPPKAVAAGLTPMDFWHLERGSAPSLGLHAVFRAPAGSGMTSLAGIEINGAPLRWGAQLTTTFEIGLHGVFVPQGDVPDQLYQACPNEESPVPNRPAPYQLLALPVMKAHQLHGSDGDSSTAAPVVRRGGKLLDMALVTTGTRNDTRVSFLDPETGKGPAKDIRVTVKQFIENQCYHVPGNTGGGTFNILVLDIEVGDQAPTGQLDLLLGSGFNAAGRAFLTVEA